MSRVVVEIPVEVWEQCQRDAEIIAQLHKELVRLKSENNLLKNTLHEASVIGKKMREMIGDHHWTMRWDYLANYFPKEGRSE